MSAFDALQQRHDAALGSVRRGAVRQRARLLAVKLGVPVPGWALIRPTTGGRPATLRAVKPVPPSARPAPPQVEPTPPPAPTASPPLVPQTFDDVRAWARAGESGERALEFAATGAVTLISFAPGERRAASFPTEAEALAAIAAGSINWRSWKRSAAKAA